MKYFCGICWSELDESEVYHREEDNTFSAPFGDLKVVIGGQVDKIAICPDCREDLEEVNE